MCSAICSANFEGPPMNSYTIASRHCNTRCGLCVQHDGPYFQQTNQPASVSLCVSPSPNLSHRMQLNSPFCILPHSRSSNAWFRVNQVSFEGPHDPCEPSDQATSMSRSMYWIHCMTYSDPCLIPPLVAHPVILREANRAAAARPIGM